jgi:cation diffusion facilitator CzcD-associated flavoprotein CzcO
MLRSGIDSGTDGIPGRTNGAHSSATVVIGGGASGLSAAGALQRAGIETVVLEQDAQIGGTWTRRYDRLHLHTVRGFSGLAHYPIPRKYPQYLSRDQFAAYLGEYARELKLRVETGCTVRTIRPPSSANASWIVETSRGTWVAPVVVVATGQYHDAVMPEWPGRDEFRGELLHTSGYTNATAHAGRKVLVVGAGNSGTEIAADLAEHGAASVTLSVRTAPPIVPRDPFGMPIHRTSMLLSMMPPAVADFMARFTSRLVLGDLTRHGMPAPAWMPYTSRRVPVIDVGFVEMLRKGRLRVRPALTRLTSTGAMFADGSTDAFDVVIAATGFRTGLSDLLDPDGVLDPSGEPLAASGSATARPGLFFTGYVHSLRGHLFETNRSSRRLARTVREYLGRTSPTSVGAGVESVQA